MQINAVEEVLLARRFVVEGYPTLVLMKGGYSYAFEKPSRSVDTVSAAALAPKPEFGSGVSKFAMLHGVM